MLLLNGWKRLWAVVGVLYLGFVVVLVGSEWPTREKVIGQWADALRQVTYSRLVGMYDDLSAERVLIEVHAENALYLTRIPKDILDPIAWREGYSSFERFVQSRPPVSLQGGVLRAFSITAIDANHERELQTLAARQEKILGTATLVWALPMAALYAFGSTAKWWWRPIVQNQPRVGVALLIVGSGLLVLGIVDSNGGAAAIGTMMLVSGFLLFRKGKTA